MITLANGKPIVIGYPTMFISRALTSEGFATANYNKGAMIREAILSVVCENTNVYLADTLSSIGRISADNSLNVLRDNIHPQPSTELLIAKSFAKATITALSNDKINIPITSLNNGGYQVMTLSNGWVNNAGGYDLARYYKDGSGIVHLDGVIKNGTYTAGTTLTTLPVGYRPAYNKLFCCPYSGGMYVVQVLSTGVVSIFVAPPTSPSVWIGLNGITFRTD
jgi:hypothetical protein